MDMTRLDLERMSTRDLVARWREVAGEMPVQPADVYEELSRRNVARVNNLLLVFTVVVTVATVAALAIALTRA
jgi:hypothetical protein